MQCPICRALLNGAETFRRCRAELKQVQDVERQGRELAGAAMHLLALGHTVEGMRLLRRACVVHATPEVRLLSMIVKWYSREADQARLATAATATPNRRHFAVRPTPPKP